MGEFTWGVAATAMSVKWVVDPFGDGNGNGKKWVNYNQIGVFTLKGAAMAKANLYIFGCFLPLPPPRVNSCNDSVAVAITQCERTFKLL